MVINIVSTYKFAVLKGWLTRIHLSYQSACFCWAWRADPYGYLSTRASLWHDCSICKLSTEVCDTQQHILHPFPSPRGRVQRSDDLVSAEGG